MMGPPGQLFAVTRNAFVEGIRQPFYVAWLLLILLAMPLGLVAAYTFDDDNQMALVTMLSMLLAGGMVLAGVLPPLIVRREIDNQTALTVVSKPLPRPMFVVGKYLGVAGAVLLAEASWTLLLLMLRRHGVMSTASDRLDWPVIACAGLAIVAAMAAGALANYFFNKNFGSTLAKVLAAGLLVAWVAVLLVGKGFTFQSPATDFEPQVLAAAGALWAATLVLAAVGVAAAVRLTLVPALILVILVAAVGVSSDYFLGAGSGLTGVLWALVPNFQFLFLADALTQQSPITAGYMGSVTLYAALMITAALGVAVALFQTRQVG